MLQYQVVLEICLALTLVDDFVNILYDLPLNDQQTIYTICDDTLGGLTAVDPRKFAGEFIDRRKGKQSAAGKSASKKKKGK